MPEKPPIPRTIEPEAYAMSIMEISSFHIGQIERTHGKYESVPTQTSLETFDVHGIPSKQLSPKLGEYSTKLSFATQPENKKSSFVENQKDKPFFTTSGGKSMSKIYSDSGLRDI